MFETYNKLLAVDISLMSDEEKKDHAPPWSVWRRRYFLITTKVSIFYLGYIL
jgi:hypothetical protein